METASGFTIDICTHKQHEICNGINLKPVVLSLLGLEFLK